MKKELIYGVCGLLIGAGIAGLATMHVRKNDTSVMQHEGMTMDDMANSLKGKTGDDFDKAFIEGMIEHHQGAIDMAKLVKDNAKHDEIKDMADDIISAQSKEIDMMQTWQTDWEYENAPTSHDTTGH